MAIVIRGKKNYAATRPRIHAAWLSNAVVYLGLNTTVTLVPQSGTMLLDERDRLETHPADNPDEINPLQGSEPA